MQTYASSKSVSKVSLLDETLMLKLKQYYTIILVTHNILQAERMSDRVIFMCQGEVIEQGSKEMLFNAPKEEQTSNYLKDEFCEC